MPLRDFIPGLKKIRERQVREAYPEATVRASEQNRRSYIPRDIVSIEAMQRAVGVVWQCADTNAKVCSSQPLRLYRRTDTPTRSRVVTKSMRRGMDAGVYGKAVAEFASGADDVEVVERHPALTLLSDPSPDMTALQWSWLRFFMQELTGKAYSLIGWSETTGRPVSMNPMLSQYTEVLYDADEGGISGFRYGRSESNPITLEPDDVAYFRHSVSPWNPYEGVGPLQSVLAEADLLVSVLIHDKTSADAGFKPPAIATIPADATEEQVRQVRNELRARGGPQSAGDIHVTRAGDLSITELQWNPKDLQTQDQIDRYERRIRQAFGHTESMADSNSSTYASAVVGYSEQYMGAAIRPRLQHDASQITRLMSELFDFDPDEYCFVYDDPVVSDVESLTTRMISLRTANVLSVNDVRSEMGYEPIEGNKDADDPLYVASPPVSDPLAMFGGVGGGAGTTIVDTTKSVAPEPDSEPEPEPAYSVTAIADGLELKRWTPCEVCGKSVDGGDIANDPLLDEIFDRFGDDVDDAMRDALQDLQDEYVRAATEGGTADVASLVEQIESEMTEMLEPVVATVVDDTRRTLSLSDDAFDVVNQRALDFLKTHTSRVASDIDSTTREMIGNAVQRGIEQGKPVTDIAAEIEAADLPGYRAERIARTELSEVSHGARYESWKEAGVESVTWRTAPGATSAHRQIAARSPKAMGEPFVKAGEQIGREKFSRDVYYPPARPNCRCSIIINEVDQE